MAKKAKTKTTTRPRAKTGWKRRPLLPVHPRAAGLDVGATFHVVAAPPDCDPQPVRSFNSFTGDLQALADWLKSVDVTTIAMESTGVYWVPVFEILEARGFEVLLVNARDAKNVPGRKTDVNDAQWLQQLHEHGLLRGSFRPRDGVARLRALLRHRERVVEYAASHIQHMQKALMLMNVQLHHVVSDITGTTLSRNSATISLRAYSPSRSPTTRCERAAPTLLQTQQRSPALLSRFSRTDTRFGQISDKARSSRL